MSGVPGNMGPNILQEIPLEKHRLCLVKWRDGAIILELWIKTRRRKMPWDRCIVAHMHGREIGLTARDPMPYKAEPFSEGIRELLPEFNSVAITATVDGC